MKPTLFVSALAAVLGSASMTLGHEFWIEPTEFQVQNDEAVVAHLRNGELFEGTSLSFSERRNTRMEAVMGDAVTPVAGRMGDRPAIQLPAIGEDGLLILVHEAAPATVRYRDWAKFLRFTAHKDFDTAEAIHIARGWAQDDFEERYTRHSKALIAVGDGAGADRALGLATEFVALDNPYAADFDGTMDVALLYDGAPRSDAQIEVYARDAQDQVTVSILRTDAQGHAAVPLTPGADYLLDAVVLREAPEATTATAGPVWETLWASLTFSVPAR